jgi:hypothetical protein
MDFHRRWDWAFIFDAAAAALHHRNPSLLSAITIAIPIDISTSRQQQQRALAHPPSSKIADTRPLMIPPSLLITHPLNENLPWLKEKKNIHRSPPG